MNDLYFINELEKEIGINLKHIYPGWVFHRVYVHDDDKKIYGQSYQFGYVVTKDERIIGLNLHNLNLTGFPKTIFKLLNIESLRLSKNKISLLRSDIIKLKRLNYLNLDSNNIKYIPPEIIHLNIDLRLNEDLDTRNGLILSNNPIETPPFEIINRGKDAVIEYYRSLKEDHEIPLNEGKVILVGDGGAGKTSLVKQLLGEFFNQNERQTDGINIKNWKFQKNGKSIKANLWDFGGQEIMHATHQFFLSKRCLYILLLDGRKDEKTEYWLKHIESFGGDSPIIIVINKIDENPSFDVNRKFLKEKYKGIRGFFRISCKTGEGIQQLSEAIQDNLSTIDIINTKWPSTWFGVKEYLERITTNYISCEEYEKICEEHKILSTSQEILLDFLHDLGVVLHFKELSLKDLNVINPKWVTEAVYAIINSEQVAMGGILNVDILKEILDKKKYPDSKHNYIVELMIKFELCYYLSNNVFLIPNLLGVEEPEYDFSTDSLIFIFSYDFLPKSIIPRFMIKMNKNIKDKLCWRTGVILEDKSYGTIALIKADEEEKRIHIKVSGGQRKDYFSIIRHQLREINNSFEKLSVKELIPLPDHPDIEIEYIELVGYEIAGNDNMFIGKLGKTYSVSKILNGIEKKEEREKDSLKIINIQGDYYDNTQIIHENHSEEGKQMYQPKTWEKVIVYLTGFLFLGVISYLLIRNEPFKDLNLVVILRTVLSLVVATFGATVPGMLNVDFSRRGILIRASGALALFIVTFLITPTVLK